MTIRADLLDNTPIFDIKPYLPFTDSHPEAIGGFADAKKSYALEVDFPADLQKDLPKDVTETITALLSEDPRPSYQEDPDRIYGMEYGGYEVRFTVSDGKAHVVELLSDKIPPQ